MNKTSSSANIARIIGASSHLKELDAQLDAYGFEFKSPKEMRKFLRKCLAKSNKERIDSAVKRGLEDISELPYSEVVGDHTRYRIHGVFHGQRPYGFPVGSMTKRFVSEQLAGYDNMPEEGYLFETGFDSDFDLDPEFEMRFHSDIFQRMGDEKFDRLYSAMLFESLLIRASYLISPIVKIINKVDRMASTPSRTPVTCRKYAKYSLSACCLSLLGWRWRLRAEMSSILICQRRWQSCFTNTRTGTG